MGVGVRQLRSAIWDDFEILNHVEKTARCLRCKRTLSYGATISNLRTHLARCLWRPRQGANILEYFSREHEGEHPTCELCKEEVFTVSKESLKNHLMEKHPDIDFLDDDDLTDASCDQVDVSATNHEEKAWKFFSRPEGSELAECRLCSETVPCDASTLINHLLDLHGDTPLNETLQEVDDVVIETFVDEREKEVPKKKPKWKKAKRKYSRAKRVTVPEKLESTKDKCLEPFAGYLMSLLKELPSEESRRLQTNFILQVYKIRKTLAQQE